MTPASDLVRHLTGGPAAPLPLTPAEARVRRRQRLTQELQGRPLEQAYLRPEVRSDLEAEAADRDPDQMITPQQLEYLHELVAAQAQAAAPGAPVAFGLWHPDRQAVIVPGFLGSELSDLAPRGTGLIWISPALALFDRLSLLQLARYDNGDRDLLPSVQIEATGPLPAVYDLLRLALRLDGYGVSVHPVDWRKDLDTAADALVVRLRALATAGQPIHLIAHSQGAPVARRALQKLRDTADAATLNLVTHLVLLGPANFGTFSAAFAIAGTSSLLTVLRRYAVSPGQGFPRVAASMTGLYQILPWDELRIPWLKANRLGTPDFWAPAPHIDADRLGRFFGWGGRTDTGFFNDRTRVILGDNYGQPTYAGAAFQDGNLMPSTGLDSDGTVTHSCAVLPGTATYLAAGTEHWRLPMYPGVIRAVLSLLAEGPASLPPTSDDPAAYLTERPLPPATPAALPAAAAAFAVMPGPVGAVPPTEVTLDQVLRTAARVAVGTGTRVRLAFEVDPPSGASAGS
jgi:pimeloyl-ACP methyl ester carboxylesterase